MNNCGRGRHIVKAWVCSDAETGGRYALGAVVICSEKRDSRFSGYTSLLDDNVHTGMKCRPADKN